MRSLFAAALAAGALLVADSATGAPSPADLAVAQRAFDDGRELFRTEHFEAACDKFALSQRLDPKLGTLLNLAICHEKIGRWALASTEFHDARSLASADNKPERVDFADKRIAAIAPHLAFLRIHVDKTNRAGIEVSLDDGTIGEAALESEIPVDPGAHRVVAKARGQEPWSGTVTCTEGAKCTLTVPTFAVAITPPVDGPSSHGGRIAGAITLGVAAVALAVGGTFGGLAIAQRAKAEDLCARSDCAAGQSANDRGVTFAWVSNVGLGLGGALFVVGLVLVVVDPGHKAPVQASAGGLVVSF